MVSYRTAQRVLTALAGCVKRSWPSLDQDIVDRVLEQSTRVSIGVAKGHKQSIDLVRDFDLALISGYYDPSGYWASAFNLAGIPTVRGTMHIHSVPYDRAWILRDLRHVVRLFWKAPTCDPSNGDVAAVLRRVYSSGRGLICRDRVSNVAPIVERLVGCNTSLDTLPIGRVGPGSVATGEKDAEKWNITVSLSGVPDDMLKASPAAPALTPECLGYRSTKLLFVPKDVRGPRAISSEPLSCQFAQFSVSRELERMLRKVRKYVPLESQEYHRRLLANHEYASIDLSDASDHISSELINQLFPLNWGDVFNATRSTHMSYGGMRVPLGAFAPMGSSLCFPVLSIVCYAIVKSVVYRTPYKIFSVYGDDIICHRKVAHDVLSALEAFGLKPNYQKSCFGNFVESCGVDLMRFPESNIDFTPVYWRVPLSSDDHLTNVDDYRLFELLARLKDHGYEIDPLTCGVNRRFAPPTRFNRRYQYLEHKVPSLVPYVSEYDTDGWPGLLRWFSLRAETSKQQSRGSRLVVRHQWQRV